MDLRCPIDHVAFVTLAICDTEINYCPKCGLWIDSTKSDWRSACAVPSLIDIRALEAWRWS